MNLVEASIDGDSVVFGQYRVPLAPGRRPPAPVSRLILGIRPESFEDAAFAPGLPSISVVVDVLEELGSDAHVFFRVDAAPITAEVLEASGDEALLVREGALFTARVDTRTSARVGDRLELAVDASRFQFFDGETGARLAVGVSEPTLTGAR
jgi:multiple sugar transport system ATP-binding protein